MTVRELLGSIAGRHVALLPNPGNCGDGLIFMGLRRLCEQFRISATELQYPLRAPGEILLALACGNMCRPYHAAVERIRHYFGDYRHIYILPCSIDPAEPAVETFVRTLPEHVELFCRETESHRLAGELVPDRRRLHLDHDLAFELDYAPWQRTGIGNLSAFRNDPESAGEPPPGNADVSMWGGEWMGEFLLDVIAGVASVHTDHIHVAIAGAMLNKETHLYRTAYHKATSIYEYSLRGRPNVNFASNRANIPATDAPHAGTWRDLAGAWFAGRIVEGFG